MRSLGRAVAAIGIWALSLTTGCAGFFVYPGSTGTGGTGTTGTGDYVYVANESTESLAGFEVGTGSLTAVTNSPYSLGFVPKSVVVNPADTLLFVSGYGSAGAVIYAYSIGTDGALTVLNNGSAVSSTLEEVSMAVSPDGQWLMGLDANNSTLDEFQINSSTGELTGPTYMTYSSSVTGTINASQVQVAPNGEYVFAALGTAGDIVYQLDTSTGVLSGLLTLPPITSTTSDNGLAVNSSSTYLYIARSGTSGGLAIYTIGSGGGLAEIGGSPLAAGSQPSSVVVNTAGTDIYVANQSSGTISEYSVVASTGAVAALSPASITTVSAPWALAVDNSGDYLLSLSEVGNPDLAMYSYSSGQLVFSTSAASGTDPAGAVAIAATH